MCNHYLSDSADHRRWENLLAFRVTLISRNSANSYCLLFIFVIIKNSTCIVCYSSGVKKTCLCFEWLCSVKTLHYFAQSKLLAEYSPSFNRARWRSWRRLFDACGPRSPTFFDAWPSKKLSNSEFWGPVSTQEQEEDIFEVIAELEELFFRRRKSFDIGRPLFFVLGFWEGCDKEKANKNTS